MSPRVEVRRLRQLAKQRALPFVENAWHDDVRDRVQVAGLVGGPRQTASREAQLLAGASPGRHLERNGAPGRGQIDRRSERRFPGRERKVDVQVLSRSAIQRMGLALDVEVEIAVASSVDALAALPRNAQLLAVDDALRDAHLDAPRN